MSGGTSVTPRSESELARLIAPLEPFVSYFDYCSSAFIFIGLLGTIFGFVSGVPKMANDNYQFEDVLRALSTSAVGIMLALVFNLATLALDYFLLRPVLAKLRLQFQGDPLEISVREHLTRLENTLAATLVTFNSGVSQIVAAFAAWNETSQQTLSGQSRIATDIATTHQSFVETHKALVGLPESIRKQLVGVFSDATSSLSTTLGKIKIAVESFEKLPTKIEAGLDKSFQKRQQVIEEALTKYRESIESQRSSLDDLYAKLRALPVDVAESLSQSNAKSIVLMEQSHAAFLNSLKTAVRATVEDQMASLGSLVGQMDLNAKTLREKWDALLASERKSFEGAVLAALQATIQTVEEQRKKLLTMESTLPESLALTFHELIKESQASTQSLNEATRQEGASIREFQSAIAEITVLLRQTSDRTPFIRDLMPDLKPYTPAQGPALSSPMQTAPFRDTRQWPGPSAAAPPQDSHPMQPENMQAGFGAGGTTAASSPATALDPPAVARNERIQPTPAIKGSAPVASADGQYDRNTGTPPFDLTAEEDDRENSWLRWPRRLWAKVRPNGSTPRT